MKDFSEIPFEIQAMLVAGYFAYKITTIGLARVHQTEDTIFQVFAFGLAAWFASSQLLALLNKESLPSSLGIPLTVVIGVLLGMAWRRWGDDAVSKAMNNTGIHNDDHQSSTWASIMNGKRHVFDAIRIEVEDGTIYESHMQSVPGPSPFEPLTSNNDGIAIYITKRIDPEGSVFETSPLKDSETKMMKLSFFPRDELKKVDFYISPKRT
jgi:hypothetical protein